MTLFGLAIPSLVAFAGFGLLVGISFGFLGMGGSVLVTPALLVVGYPAPVAVGSGLAFVFGTSVSSVLRHRTFGQIEYALAGLMAVGTITGTWLGNRTLLALEQLGRADLVVAAVYTGLLGTVGLFVLRGARSEDTDAGAVRIAVGPRMLEVPPTTSLPGGATVSVWIVVAVGLGVGVLSGFLGVGGGFVLLPVMVYGFGVPAVVAVGTTTLQITITSAFGTFVYAQSNAVGVPVVAALLAGSTLGARIGAGSTRLVRDVDVERYLAAMLLAGCVAVASTELGAAYGVETIERAGVALVFGATVLVSCAIVAAAVAGLSAEREPCPPRAD